MRQAEFGTSQICVRSPKWGAPVRWSPQRYTPAPSQPPTWNHLPGLESRASHEIDGRQSGRERVLHFVAAAHNLGGIRLAAHGAGDRLFRRAIIEVLDLLVVRSVPV